jgi:DNA topoisomerase-2
MDGETVVTLGDREHLLLRPDTLCGSTAPAEHVMPVYELRDGVLSMSVQKLVFAPAVRNLIQEIVTNALDRQYRDASMKHIDVWIDSDEAGGAGCIRVRNDGMGVPVCMDAETQAWQPTVAFSHFRSGTNFQDSDGPRFTAGRNGYGCKATNVFSQRFTVKTADPRAQRMFAQTFSENMSTASAAVVKPFKLKRGYTDVSFLLDFVRLGCDDGRMSGDVKRMAITTIIHACGCLTKRVALNLNNTPVPVSQLKQLAALFGDSADAVACDVVKDAGGQTTLMEVCVTRRRVEYGTLGFVNSLECNEGTHVNYALSRLVAALEQVLRSKYKKGADFTLSPALVRKHVFLAVKLLVDSPAFSSQTKEKLTTPPTRFNVTWTPSTSFLRVLTADDGVLSALYQDVLDKEVLAARRSMASVTTSTASGTSRRHVVADKYDAATALRSTPAGRRSECSLLVTEGDSARALAVAGLAVVGREYFGIYALKGKPLNVRTATTEAIAKNKEISTLLQILGLTYGKVYTSLAELNYKKLVIFSDQDYDGAHIGGLILNVMHALFPSVLQLDPAFVQRFPTPLVRATHNRTRQVHAFYAKPEFDAWAASASVAPTLSQYTIRYFKGLGTSTSALAREYFSNYSNSLVDIVWTRASDEVMLHMFGGDQAMERRQLLVSKYDKDLFADYSQRAITYEDFVYREVLPYSNYSNVRNIACVVDGFKPVQRKALFTLLDKHVVQDMKVAQVAALVAAHTQYHHGEQSLVETVVGMAQDHVGVSNINLFKPEGQFGSRLDPPSEHSAARYIFTALDDVTRALFHPADDAVLERVVEEGSVIEPVFYVPVIPMVLVNGAFGIGTGWSSGVPCFDPLALVDVCVAYVNAWVSGGIAAATTAVSTLCAPHQLLPWYDGFQGTISYDAATGSYKTRGCAQIDEARCTIRITELPVGGWTHPFVETVEKRMMGGESKSPSARGKRCNTTALVTAIDKQWTDSVVDMTLHCNREALQQLVQAGEGGCESAVLKELGLESELRISNMHLHDATGKLKKYDSVAAILLEFASVRLTLYERRKQHMVAVLQKQLLVAQQKARFIAERVFDHLRDLRDEQVQALLADQRFVPVDGDYNYLLGMTFKSLTQSRVDALHVQVTQLQVQLDELHAATPASLWLQDLTAARIAITHFRTRKAARYATSSVPATSASQPRAIQRVAKRQRVVKTKE